MTVIQEWSVAERIESSYSFLVIGTFVCNHCHWPNIGSVVWNSSAEPGFEVRAPDREQRIRALLIGSVVVWHPDYGSRPSFPDVPSDIASAASEAYSCFSINAYRGAIMLARAVVEATAKEKGVNEGMLGKKIQVMADRGIISEHMRQVADEIKFAGNEIAHADSTKEPLSKEDAEDVLQLMSAILLRVYQEPAQVSQVRERRRERSGK